MSYRLSPVVLIWIIELFIARSLGYVLLLTLTPPEVGKSLVKLS